MLRFTFVGARARSATRGVQALVALVAALVVSSCLTPTINFDDGPSVTGGTSSSGGGTTSGGGGAPNTTGGTNFGGEGGTIEPPVPHCINREQDSDETDRDCGGLDCPKCANGKKCDVDGDCKIDSCVTGRCLAPSCTDEVKNGDETDVDCGVPETGCALCGDGDSCAKHEGCDSGVCKSGKCQVPTCSDNTRNGDETDVDCGGDDCDPCDVGAICDGTDDCAQPPDPEDEAFVSCEDHICVITCGPFLGDCNDQVEDSCETNLLTSTPHCGACRAACAPDNAMGECSAGNCLIDIDAPDTDEGCLGDFANCNGEVSDGCEANLQADPGTCGSCDVACSENNGTADCDAGTCTIECDPGFDDCNSDVLDGCEIDLTVSTLHCTECFNACSATPPEVPVCDGTQCVGVTCDQPADCGGVQPCGACDQDSPDPLCNDVLNTTTHCGGCGIDCTAANATTVCVDSSGYSCAIDQCTGSYADCDEDYLNGCEIETDTNRNRCGGCLSSDPAGGSGENCDLTKGPQVAQTSCSSGDCRVLSCNSGYADCNGVWSDGCEMNLNTAATHCGGCTSGPTTTWDGGANCNTVYPNATGACSAGQCSFSSCTGAYQNCNSSIVDGCEVLTQGDPDNCGGCGDLSAQYVCATNAGTASNTCTGSATSCTPTCVNNSGTTGADYGNCDGENWDGCEQGLQSSTSNCGACGNNCTTSMHASGASAACSAASCAIATCDPNLADCNGTWGDGCEVNTSSNVTNCGGCQSGPTTAWDGGANCTTTMHSSGASAQCTSSACAIATCDSGLADCNGTWSDGCEVTTATSATHCGGCSSGPTTTWDGGTDCNATMHSSGASAQCGGSACSILTCDAGLADCNGTWSDGCEINITSNATHCGGCQSGPTTTWDGGQTCTDKQNATVSGCSGSACTYTCASGWFNTNGDWADGCESRALTRVGVSGVISGDIASTGATGTYTVITSAGNYRLLLVGVICKANVSADCTMTTKTFGGQALTQLGTTTGSGDSWASMYYLLEAGIAAATSTTLVLDSAAGWGAVSAQVVEYSGAEQTAPIAIFGGGSNSNDCTNTATDAVVTLSGVLSGSEVFAVSGGHSSAGTATAVAPLSTLLGNNFNDPLDVLFASTAASNQSGTLNNLTIGLTGCFRSSIFAAAIKREVLP